MNAKIITAVWQKATPIRGYSSSEWRIDRYGMTSRHGWEIEHAIPKSRGGSDELANLFPMRWHENREKSIRTQSEYELDKFVENLRAARSNWFA